MAKLDYMPNDDEGKAALFLIFRAGIGAHLAALGIPAGDPDILQQAADAVRFRAVLDFNNTIQGVAQAWTAQKNSELTGSGTMPVVLPQAILPAGFPPAVPPGIVARFRALMRRVKACGAYNAAMGLGLGIEGTAPGGPDFATLKPVLTLGISGGHVQIGWDWGGYAQFLDMVEIQADRGDGKGFVLVAFDTTPGYTDTAPFPAAPVKWLYRAIYHLGDAATGQWSQVVGIVVGG